jgi:ABC-2 type transport system ATP-binding protein
LDPKGQQDIQKTLLQLNHEKEVTIFLSSHALSEVSSLCKRVAIVNRGRLVAQGSIDELRTLAGSSSGLVVRILNSQSAQKELSNLPYRIQLNATDNNKLIDVNISDGVSESGNDIIDSFEKPGLQIYEIRRMGMSLEDVYFKLTEAKKKEDQHTYPGPQQEPKSKEEQRQRHA